MQRSVSRPIYPPKQLTYIVGFHRRSKDRLLVFHAVFGSGIFRRLHFPLST